MMITTNADGSEQLQYNSPDFPVRIMKNTLGIFFDFMAGCHWHRDFEALVALDGEMDYFVNGEIVHLKQGQAIFVNSGRMHYGFSREKKDCVYSFIVYSPQIFGEFPPVSHELERLCSDQSPNYLLLTGNTPEEARAIELIRGAEMHLEEESTIERLSRCAELTVIIQKQIPETDASKSMDDESWILLRIMTGYIQSHYAEQIPLDDLAASASVCRSRCCKLFQDKLGCTPGKYITRYRLNKACMDITHGCSITEAALNNGFNSSSYFAESFRKEFGISPKDYRAMQHR